MRWTDSQDGIKRVNVRALWRFDRAGLAEVLAAAIVEGQKGGEVFVHTFEQYDEAVMFSEDGSNWRSTISPARADGLIRAYLLAHGSASIPYWRETWEESEQEGQPDADELAAWCVEQAARL
jgi:hypothetical protein